MPRSFDVAQIDIGDVELTVVFLPEAGSAALYQELESAASKAHLPEIVIVWSDEHGRTRFIAQPARHAFFQTVGIDQLRAQLRAQINSKLELG